ncbi:MAG: transposase, partial [Muribaculum sp.]|nr:transposase [Muribaculum sp.]
MGKSGYTTDLTIRQLNFIFANFPEIFHTKSKADIFEILNALFYLTGTGCRWKLLPHGLPKWRTVYEF